MKTLLKTLSVFTKTLSVFKTLKCFQNTNKVFQNTKVFSPKWTPDVSARIGRRHRPSLSSSSHRDDHSSQQ